MSNFAAPYGAASIAAAVRRPPVSSDDFAAPYGAASIAAPKKAVRPLMVGDFAAPYGAASIAAFQPNHVSRTR